MLGTGEKKACRQTGRWHRRSILNVSDQERRKQKKKNQNG